MTADISVDSPTTMNGLNGSIDNETSRIPCLGEGCPNDCSVKPMKCPTCQTLGRTSYFCSQDCFTRNWPTHKALHAATKPKDEQPTGPPGTYDPFLPGAYTGKIRATYPLPAFDPPSNTPYYSRRESKNPRRDYPFRKAHPKREIKEGITIPDYAEKGIWKPLKYVGKEEIANRARVRAKPVPEEDIQGMRKVCRLAREVLDLAAAALRPGITTHEIDQIVFDACMERDSYPSPLGYYGFPRSVCTSINEVICHGIPDHRPLEEGDIVNLDVTLYHNGFHGDLNATYPVGRISDDSKHLIETTRRCLDAAIAICKPGVPYREVGNIISPVAENGGLSVVRTYSGHGINRLFHGTPNIPHYKGSKTVGEMQEGNIFTIEPMINQGKSDDAHWPDNWTAVTVDGLRSAQFEETLLITKDGVEVLTAEKGWKLPEDLRREGVEVKTTWDGEAAAGGGSGGAAGGKKKKKNKKKKKKGKKGGEGGQDHEQEQGQGGEGDEDEESEDGE